MSSLEGKQFRMDAATVRRWLQLSLVPQSPDLALLLLRVWIGTSLFLRHGLEKLFGNSEMIKHFPDPLHIGTYASFAVSTFSDGICSILVIFGFAARWSALTIFANIFVAWATVVRFQFFADGVSPGEAIVLYLGGFLTVLLAGSGRFSLDSLLTKY
jgi:putative oxidoreductase